MKTEITEILEAALGESIVVDDVRPLSGGDISDAMVVETHRGRLFVKCHHSGPADLFEREAEALQQMRATDTELVIPEPLAATRPTDGRPAALVLTYIESGPRADDFDERLGRGLAALHGATADAYGFDDDNYCGTTPQPNDWTDDWVQFYDRRRLRHQLQICDDRRGFSPSDRRTFERLLDGLDDVIGDADHPPALIHGDLWSGNLQTTADGHPAIIDPAAYFGHPEAEIGMMDLFGGFSETVYEAYEEVRPLPDGWRHRISLYSLYHVMNHYYLFGGHYGRRAVEIANSWVP